MSERIHRPSTLTPDERQRHREIRERFQRERPSLEQLVASGEYTPPIPQGVYLEILRLCADLRRLREASGLSLPELAARTGLDAAAWQRLESGGSDGLTVAMVVRYKVAAARRSVLNPHPVSASRIRNRPQSSSGSGGADDSKC